MNGTMHDVEVQDRVTPVNISRTSEEDKKIASEAKTLELEYRNSRNA